jgi:hypothetical protein
MSLQGEMHSMVPKVWTATEAGPIQVALVVLYNPETQFLHVLDGGMFLHATALAQ